MGVGGISRRGSISRIYREIGGSIMAETLAAYLARVKPGRAIAEHVASPKFNRPDITAKRLRALKQNNYKEP
jgi:hypothetical protein